MANAPGRTLPRFHFFVEPGALWFEGEIGPVPVTKAASGVAQPGWSINIVLGRANKIWHVVEVGNVYP
jgi:hypothetical protein